MSIKRIALFTSGGDAPGMNAAIRAVVRNASYHNLSVMGIERGYEGMIAGDIFQLEPKSVSNIIHRGGTILKSARSDAFRTEKGRKEAYDSLLAYGIEGVVAIGGNGTFTGAQVFSEEYDIPFVGIPGTIDNDLYGTDFTIGFDTALNTIIDAVDKIRDTADSHNRLFFIEVMGRDAGFIALNAGIGTGAEAILLPEHTIDINSLISRLNQGAKRKKLFSLVIVAEGNPNGGAMEIAKAVEETFDIYDVKVTVLGHIQRGGAPSCSDRVLASRLGFNAVEALIKGQKNVVVGLTNNEISYTPFKEAIGKHKEININLVQMSAILAR